MKHRHSFGAKKPADPQLKMAGALESCGWTNGNPYVQLPAVWAA
jgi:hypothetical protein